jgi:hypothetical protein
MKNAAELKHDWDELKARLKLQFAGISTNDTFCKERQSEWRLLRLQSKFGKTKDEIQKLIAAM